MWGTACLCYKIGSHSFLPGCQPVERKGYGLRRKRFCRMLASAGTRTRNSFGLNCSYGGENGKVNVNHTFD